MPLVNNYTAILSGQTLNQPSVSSGSALSPFAAFVTYSFNPGDDEPDTALRSLTADPSANCSGRRSTSGRRPAGSSSSRPRWQGDIDIVVDSSTPMPGYRHVPNRCSTKAAAISASTPATKPSGTITIDPDYARRRHVLIHEIGHTLSLKHPHDGARAARPGARYRRQDGDELSSCRRSTTSAVRTSGDPEALRRQTPPTARRSLRGAGTRPPRRLTQVRPRRCRGSWSGTGANDVIDTVGGRDAVVTKAGDDVVTVHTQGIQANLAPASTR